MTEVFLQLPPPIAEQVQWYAIQTRYRFERSVMKQLQSQGVKTYLPLLEELHAWSDRSKAVRYPVVFGLWFCAHGSVLGGAGRNSPHPRRNRICQLCRRSDS